MDLDTKPFANPLVLLADTTQQCNSHFWYRRIDAPVMLSKKSFNILSTCLEKLATLAGFDYIKRPAYTIFNDDRFKGHRRTFWKPILKQKFPIYIISPLFGVIWPGDNMGLYNAAMADVFVLWRQYGLWHV